MTSKNQYISDYLPNALLSYVFIITFIFSYFFGLPLFTDPDTAWHLAAGDLIRELGNVPKNNTWSFSTPEARWYNHAWAWDVFISFIVSTFGLGGLFLFAATLKAIIAAFLCHILFIRTNATEDPIKLVIGFTAFVLCVTVGARPQLLTLLMLVIFHFVMHCSRDENDKKLFFLPILMLIWVNCHGNFVAASTIYGVYAFEAISKKDWAWLKRLCISGFACVPAIFMTPIGLEMVESFIVASQSETTQYIEEWRPFSFRASTPFDIYLLIFILGSHFGDKNTPLADKLLSLIWLVAALYSVRSFYIFALLSAPLLAINLEKHLPNKNITDLISLRMRKIAFSSAIAIYVILLIFPLRELSGKEVIIGSKVPIKALEYMRENHPDKRFFNNWGFGAYMIYYNSDIQQVFVDGRAGTSYPETFLREVMDAWDEGSYDTLVEKYNLDGLFIPAKERTPVSKKYIWKKVFEDDVATVYLRKKEKL